MKVKLTKWYHMLLAALFTLLGFESCSGSLDGDTTPVEYGTPNISFQVKGRVRAENGANVKGIRVTTKLNRSSWDGRDTVYTDAEGKYTTKKLRGFTEKYLKESLVVTFEDVDGVANGGVFEKDSLKGTEATVLQKEKGSRWYEGDFEVTADKKLKKTDI